MTHLFRGVTKMLVAASVMLVQMGVMMTALVAAWNIVLVMLGRDPIWPWREIGIAATAFAVLAGAGTLRGQE